MSELSIGHTDMPRPTSRAAAFWNRDDWWAVMFGLGLTGTAVACLAGGGGFGWIAVMPAKWSTVATLQADLASHWTRYLAQFVLWLALVGVGLSALGFRLRDVVPAFAFLYAASLLILVLGRWDGAVRYNLEPPLVALLVGLLLANTGLLPRRLDAGFRVEFYIKLGVILLGATLPLGLIVWAGPIAIAQASVVSLVTFFVIFAAARALGLEPRLAATLGVGGAVCGVSAAIAIAAAVGARRQDAAAVISIVVVWAIVMIFVLPFAAGALHLPAGVGGAWIGTSEFADVAGFAAAQAYGAMVARAAGTAGQHAVDQSVAAFTLMKVVGRDIWLGIWAVALSIVATTRWSDGVHVAGTRAGEVWTRFPKFVIGFFLASAGLSLVALAYGQADFAKVVTPAVVTPIKTLRTWAFTFGFLSIGLTTRLGDLAGVGWRPAAAFSAGVVVNLALGFVLSVLVFGAYWQGLTP